MLEDKTTEKRQHTRDIKNILGTGKQMNKCNLTDQRKVKPKPGRDY